MCSTATTITTTWSGNGALSITRPGMRLLPEQALRPAMLLVLS